MPWRRRRRREQTRARPFPPAWRRYLERNVPYYRLLPDPDRQELREHVLVLVDEKRFEGAGGMVVDDEVSVTIAGHAAILLLHRDTDYYPLLDSVVIYPDLYEAKTARGIGGGAYVESHEIRAGESWHAGTLVLSWADVEDAAAGVGGGQNVVLHEFAHQLDHETGDANGMPKLASRAQREAWGRVFTAEYAALEAAVERGEDTLIDDYGIESPAEFFAVVTECFFELPIELSHQHPELYAQLRELYQQDPAALVHRARCASRRPHHPLRS